MNGKYIDGPINKYLDDLAAKKPAPGGGSAGALSGALAAGLVSMAVNFSIGKCPSNEKKLKVILKQSENLRKKMSELVDKDVEAYKAVSTVFKSSKANKEKIQKVLRNAAAVPLEIAQAGVEIMQLNRKLLPICNPRLISDIGVSLSLAYSSVEIGMLNVKENLANIEDEKFSKICRTKLMNLAKVSRKIKNEIYLRVEKIISR